MGNQWPAGTGKEKQRREVFILGSIVNIHINEDSGHWPRHLQCPAVLEAKNNHRNVNPVRYEEFIQLLFDLFSLCCSGNRLAFTLNGNGNAWKSNSVPHVFYHGSSHIQQRCRKSTI